MAGFSFKQFAVSPRAKRPLLDFIVLGLQSAGCSVLHATEPSHAPFFITFETPGGERQGVLVYAFLANSRVTRNRPEDEHRFQVKYGGDPGVVLKIAQDPARLVTTIFVGIDPVRGVLVGADPLLHDPTPMFISVEFKRADVEQTLAKGWHVWERESSRRETEPVEVLVAVRQDRVLDYIRFERMATGLDQGHRQLLAERLLVEPQLGIRLPHSLLAELGLPEQALFDLIHQTSRLKMAVRGWVAEVHLQALLQETPSVQECGRLLEDNRPDVWVRFKGRDPILVECKNVLRTVGADGLPRLDFQRTRAAKADPCSRYYRASDFAVLAACLHARTVNWEFRFALTRSLPAHATCAGRLKSSIKVDAGWTGDAAQALELASEVA